MLLRLPETHRDALKDPLGPIHTDAPALLDGLSGPIVTVGDVVSYHVLEADRVPAVAVIDGRTQRAAVDPGIESTLAAVDVDRVSATNPPGTITDSLVEAIARGLDRIDPVQVIVDGEEDLAALPAVLLAPEGAAVLYGQPSEGIVHVAVSPETQSRVRELLALFEGDHERLEELLSE